MHHPIIALVASKNVIAQIQWFSSSVWQNPTCKFEHVCFIIHIHALIISPSHHTHTHLPLSTLSKSFSLCLLFSHIHLFTPVHCVCLLNLSLSHHHALLPPNSHTNTLSQTQTFFRREWTWNTSWNAYQYGFLGTAVVPTFRIGLSCKIKISFSMDWMRLRHLLDGSSCPKANPTR